jgi:hypothetical protein
MLEKHVFLWANRVLWVEDSDSMIFESNTMLVRSADFFSDPKKEFKKICQHFGIVPPEELNLPPFNVKSAGYNYQDAPLREVVPQPGTPVRRKEGVIPPAVIESSSMVREAREWVRSNLPINEDFL